MTDQDHRLRILLLRHGEAAGSADPGLTRAGRLAVQSAARRAATAGLHPFEWILHSPLRRAVETAALLAERGRSAPTHMWPELLPDGSAEAAGVRLCALAEEGVRTVAVVSHLPLLPALAAWLCDATLPFATASGWLLGAEAESAWRGAFDTERALEHEDRDR